MNLMLSHYSRPSSRLDVTARHYLALAWGVLAALTIGLICGYRIGAGVERHAATVMIAEKTAEIQDIGQRLDAANFRLDQYIQRMTWSAVASWYGNFENGRLTASGRVFNMDERIIAHKELPFGTVLMIENTTNGRFSIGQVLDHGPNVIGRSVDVSMRMAEELGMLTDGLAVVRVTVLSWPGGMTR